MTGTPSVTNFEFNSILVSDMLCIISIFLNFQYLAHGLSWCIFRPPFGGAFAKRSVLSGKSVWLEVLRSCTVLLGLLSASLRCLQMDGETCTPGDDRSLLPLILSAFAVLVLGTRTLGMAVFSP